MPPPNFNTNKIQCGFGVVRVLVVMCIAFLIVPLQIKSAMIWDEYFFSCRWLGHAYIGIAYISVKKAIAVDFRTKVVMLVGCAAFILWDTCTHDYSAVICMLKMGVVGKLDTEVASKLFLLCVLLLLLLAHFVVSPQNNMLVLWDSSSLRILSVLLVQHTICEDGCKKSKENTFFGHGYSREVTSLMMLFLVSLRKHEVAAVQVDLVIALSCRFAELSVFVISHVYLSKIFVTLALQLHSVLIGIPVLNVTDPELAALVLKECSSKGEALEKYSSAPAWLPIVSLESEDGPRWRHMSTRFHSLLHHLQPPSRLTEIAAKNILALRLAHSGDHRVIDANALAKLTVETFIEYVLRVPWREDFQVIVTASWEWRREIAIKGQADALTKHKAVSVFLSVLRETSAVNGLWDVFGEKWREPEYYSLIMQPFLISPCINIGDIIVAMHASPPGTSLDWTLRHSHPFPMLERYVDHDLSLDGTRVDIKAHTQVQMLLADFKDSTAWPVFGAGERACPGRHLALPYLRLLVTELLPLPHFRPGENHLYSGRCNDDKVTLHESVYFVRTIAAIAMERFYCRIFSISRGFNDSTLRKDAHNKK